MSGCARGRESPHFRGIAGDPRLLPSRSPGALARIDHPERGLSHVRTSKTRTRIKKIGGGQISGGIPLQQVEHEEPQFPIVRLFLT